jgi:hypothetical protein
MNKRKRGTVMQMESFQEINNPLLTREEIIAAREAQIAAVQRFVAARQRLNTLQERIVQIEAQRITPPSPAESGSGSVLTEQAVLMPEINTENLSEIPLLGDSEHTLASLEIDLLPADGDLEALPAEHFAPEDDPDKTETLEIHPKASAENKPSDAPPPQKTDSQMLETTTAQLSERREPDGTE